MIKKITLHKVHDIEPVYLVVVADKLIFCMIPLIILWTEKNKSYLISSFVETKGESMISKTAVEFVEYPLTTVSLALIELLSNY